MEERQTLNIDGKTSLMGLSFDLTAYENRHLTTSVMLKDRLSDFTDMAQAVSLGDLDNDLYVVSTYDNGIQSLKKKGVFYDLSGNQEIAAYVDSLYPTWRNLVTTEDGRIAGVPMLVNGHYQLNYRESIWEENRLGEVPKTYDELLDCIEAWHEDGRLESVRLFESGDTFRQLALQMLKNNAARYAARGEAAVYSNETLLQLLKRLEGLRDMLADYDRMNVLGEALFQTDRWYQMMYSPDYADYIDLPLGMEDENDYGCLMDLYVMVVNPRSKQPELAIQFIQETLGDRYQTSERMLVMPGEELGVINEEALAHIKQATAELQVYQEQYAQLREQGYSPDWMLPNMNALQGSLDYYADERTHYTILPEYDAIFRDAMEHVAVNAADGYLLMWDNAGNAINDFIDGKNSPESMLKKMDEVVWMWTMENQ